MKRILLLLFVAFILFPMSTASAQSMMDYVSEVRGDTLVVMDYWEKNPTDGEANTLANVMAADTVDVPAGRVYELVTNGYYPFSSSPTTPAGRDIVIAGSDYTSLVANDDADNAPPLICGFGGNSGGITLASNLTVKNASVVVSSESSMGWAFFGPNTPGMRLTLDNVMMERTRWVVIQSNDYPETEVFISNCYFVNLTGEPCRRNGGVYDNVGNPTAKMIVENSTHVMNQGMQYKFRNFEVDEVRFNHNTFVNISGQVFETQGYQSNMAIINNIFVNANVQPYQPGLDYSETDVDSLPMGIVNVRPLLSTMSGAERKILVEGNVVYWDPSLTDLATPLNDVALNGSTEWAVQTILMNTRTEDMFADNAAYPYMTLGTNYEVMPNFADPQDLFTTQLEALKTFSLATVDSNSTSLLPVWRVTSTGEENYLYSDWPIPVDLSYDNADLLVGATGQFPVGDLNWFPAKKAEWDAQKDAEHEAITAALDNGSSTLTAVAEVAVPAGFELGQNYPNPFNPSTSISYTTEVADHVTLTVFNMLGQKVKTLVNATETAGSHTVKWNGVDQSGVQVPSGVYYYRIDTNNMSQTKKMLLIK